MRAAFCAFVGCVMAVAAVSAPPADAAYPFDDLPSLPPLPGVRTAAFSDDSSHTYDPRQVVPASYDGGFADEWASFDPSFDDGYYADPYGDYPTTHPSSDTTRRLIERFTRLAAAEANESDWDDPGFDPVYGPLDGDADFGPPPSFDGAFTGGPPIWVGYVASTYMPGTDRTIWNSDWFVPLWQDGRNLWFLNLRGQIDDDDAGEFNLGTGFRTLAWPGWVFGTYVFYDRLHSANDNGFSQGTFGVEAMDVLWDFRFNVYFPESKAKAVATPASADISNGTIVVRSGVERAYWGFDIETGRLLWTWGPNARHEFRCFAGIYHFDHSAEGFDSITGPRVRFEWRCFDLPFFGLGSRLTCGFTAQADTERGGDLFAFTGLRIPLGWWSQSARPLTPLERRMLDPVVRDVDVVTNSIQRIEPAVNSHTGEVISRVHVLDKNDDLADSIAATDNNAVVVIDGSKGHILSDSPVPLQPGQSVVGGGTQFDVRGALTGKPATWTAPGSRPTIEFGASKDAEHGTAADDEPMTSGFHMADHTQLASLNIVGGRPAVEIDDAEHVDLSDVDIRDAEGAGIALNNAQHVKIEFVSIDDVGSETVVPDEWTDTDDETDDSWAGPIHRGAGIAGVNSSDVTIRNSHIQETRQTGIKFFESQDITVENTVIEDTEGPGLSFLNSENVTLTDLELRDLVTSHGVVLFDVTGSAAIRDSHIEGGSTGRGIWTRNRQEGALDLTIENNIIDGKPIRFDVGDNSLLIARVSNNEVRGDGRSIDVDVSDQGIGNLGFFDNQFEGRFDALAIEEGEMNLALLGNRLGDGPHTIANRNDAAVYLLYQNNQSPSEVVFESMGGVFGLEPLSGNNPPPTLMKEMITDVDPGTVRTRAPGIFD